MAFEMYKEKGGKYYKPSVTITAAGAISLSKSCFEKYLGDKNYANLYFDKSRGLIIGIKTVDKEVDNTFKITRSGDRASGSIAGRSFLNHLGIDFSKRKKFIPEWNAKEGILSFKVE